MFFFFVFLFFTRIRNENLVDEVDDAVGRDDVLLQHHLDAVDGQAVAVAADLDGAALFSLILRADHDGLRALDTVQQVVFHQCWIGSKVGEWNQQRKEEAHDPELVQTWSNTFAAFQELFLF